MNDRDERAARLAAQLRANLRRRKDRARAEADGGAAEGAEGAGPPPVSPARDDQP